MCDPVANLSLGVLFEFKREEVNPARVIAGKGAAPGLRIATEGGYHRSRFQVPHLQRLVLGGGDRTSLVRAQRHAIDPARVAGQGAQRA